MFNFGKNIITNRTQIRGMATQNLYIGILIRNKPSVAILTIQIL